MISLPAEFESSVREQLADEFSDFARSLDQPPPVCIRVHPSKQATIAGETRVPWSDFGHYLATRPVFTLDPLFHAGTYYVQEASSMFLEQALKQTIDLRQPHKILDLCAAPGGKSTHMLSLLNRDSLLVSNDTIRTRANVLAENIQKWGYPNAVVTSNDPSDFGRLPGFFDVVIVDAPCSGEGLFRKDPLAMQEWSPENVQLCAGRQRRILADVWDALREDGILIYCTCTYNTSENEENLRWLGENYPLEFIRLQTDPAWNVSEVTSGKAIGYRFLPHKVRGEGFFLAVMQKRQAVDAKPTRAKVAVPAPSAKIQERLLPWLRSGDDIRFFQFNDLIFFAPASLAMDQVLHTLKIVYAGTNVATVKHDKLIPEHALALSTELHHDAINKLDLDEKEVMSYLRKESVWREDCAQGFSLVRFHQQGLGWVNVLPNRFNNLYPAHWRIRMQG